MTTIAQILWLELAIKAACGSLLLLFPRTVARVFGLPVVAETFWPRLLGATLLGLAAATYLESQLSAHNGLGISGHIAINFAAVLALVSMLIMGKAAPTRRGRILVVVLSLALCVLALVELAWA